MGVGAPPARPLRPPLSAALLWGGSAFCEHAAGPPAQPACLNGPPRCAPPAAPRPLCPARSAYVPEELRSTIINFFRIPLNLFVCIVLYNVSGRPRPALSSSLPSLFPPSLSCPGLLRSVLISVVLMEREGELSRRRSRPRTTADDRSPTRPCSRWVMWVLGRPLR